MPSQNSISNQVVDNSFTVSQDTAATAVESAVIHSVDGGSTSHANFLVQTAGGSAGDPYLYFNISGAQDYALGIDNSASDRLKIQDDVNPSTGTTLLSINSTGELTMPVQSAFLAYSNTAQNNVTGAGTTYTIHYDSEVFDLNSDFNTTTYTFTAPVTGKYILSAYQYFTGITAAMNDTVFNIVTSNRTYRGQRLSAGAAMSASALLNIGAFAVADMDASDTATMQITISSGAGDTADLAVSDIQTRFFGALIT